MDEDKVIDRIRKLFKLAADNPSPAEAAVALAQAQRMMHRHRIEQTQLDAPDEEEIGLYVDEPIATGSTIPAWKQAIADVIAELNDCVSLVSESRSPVGDRMERIMVIAGRRVDFEAVVLMYNWIANIIEEAAARTSSRLASERFGSSGMGRRWINSFRHGAAAEVEERLLQEQRSQRVQLAADPTTGAALAIRSEAVEEWMQEHIDARDAGSPASSVDPEAFHLGAAVGRSMPLRSDAEE